MYRMWEIESWDEPRIDTEIIEEKKKKAVGQQLDNQRRR
jgi:hypothetical protein